MADEKQEQGGTATAAQTEQAPTHPGLGTFGKDLRIWEITVRGTGGDPERLALDIAEQIEDEEDTGAETVTYREAGNLGNPQVHDMLARVRGQDDRVNDVKARAAEQAKVTKEWQKETKEAEARGVEKMDAPEVRAGATADMIKPKAGDKK